MKKGELILLKKQIEDALRKPGRLTDKSVEKMERLFLSGEPQQLAFQYRKESFKDDKPALDKLLADKKIIQVEKTTKRITYQYVAEKRKISR